MVFFPLPTLPNWNIFTEQPVAPSLAAILPYLSPLLSHPYLHYESSQLILFSHLLCGTFILQPSFRFKFSQDLGCIHTQLLSQARNLTSKTFAFKHNINVRLYRPVFATRNETFAICKHKHCKISSQILSFKTFNITRSSWVLLTLQPKLSFRSHHFLYSQFLTIFFFVQSSYKSQL